MEEMGAELERVRLQNSRLERKLELGEMLLAVGHASESMLSWERCF